MREQQNQRQQDLQAARQALQSDEKALRQMMDRAQQALQNARGGRPMQGQQGESAMQQLQRMLQSPQMQQAMQMAQRMRQGPPMGQQAQGPRPPTPSPATTGNMTGSPTGKASDAELAKLSPDQRKALLSLPPRVREELLQGMREQGPDGYGPFIQDYFKRLTEK